jgi:hypothetical protein
MLHNKFPKREHFIANFVLTPMHLPKTTRSGVNDYVRGWFCLHIILDCLWCDPDFFCTARILLKRKTFYRFSVNFIPRKIWIQMSNIVFPDINNIGGVMVVIVWNYIYNYPCNQFLSPPKLLSSNSPIARYTRYNIMWNQVCQ